MQKAKSKKDGSAPRKSRGANPNVRGDVKAMPATAPMRKSVSAAIADMTVDLSWVAGSTYVGNGTLGAADSIYFNDLAGNLWTTAVPVMLCDTNATPLVVQSYVSDITKHFAFAHVDSLSMELQSRLPGTATNVSLAAAPLRSAQYVPVFGTGTPTAIAGATVLSMNGGQRVASYETVSVPLTGYVDGGLGADARRFPMNNAAATRTSATVVQTTPFAASFLIGGSSSGGVSFQGQKLHDVIIRARLRLIDFVGSYWSTNTYGLAAGSVAPTDQNDVKSGQLPSAGSAGVLPLGVPLLTRQTGYVMVRQEDVPASLSLDKTRSVPPNDPNRR